MRKIILLVVFLLFQRIQAQDFYNERWFFHSDISLNISPESKSIYSYAKNDLDKQKGIYGKDINLKTKPIYSTDFSVNYILSKTISVGALTGINHFRNPVATALKVGGIVRLFMAKDSYNTDIFGQLSGFIPLSKKVKASLGEAKLGLSIPIAEEDNFAVAVLLHIAYVSYDVAVPILGDEIPDIVEYRSVGLGFSIRF